MALIQRIRTVFAGVGGAPLYNNLYFSNAPTSTAAQEAVDLVTAAWDGLTSIMDIGLTGTVLGEVAELEDTTGEVQAVYAVTAGTFDPSFAGDALPHAAQGLVRLQTQTFVSGRRVRGRIFVPGLTEGANTNGVPNANTIASLTAFGTALIQVTGPELVIYTRPRLADPDATPPVSARVGSHSVVTAAAAWDQWAVLRSRRD